MRVVVRVLEAIAVLVPDFQTLGLIVPAVFSVYHCAVILGLPGTRDINADLLISLLIGYVFAVALKLASGETLPARPNPPPISHRGPRTGELSRASRWEAVKTQCVCEGAEIRQAHSFLREVRQ